MNKLGLNIPEQPSIPPLPKKKAAVNRQVIVTWFTPEEKLPPEDIEMVCTINGEALGIKFENAIVLLSWHPDEGWTSMEYFFSKLEVIAWCDLMPYGYKEK